MAKEAMSARVRADLCTLLLSCLIFTLCIDARATFHRIRPRDTPAALLETSGKQLPAAVVGEEMDWSQIIAPTKVKPPDPIQILVAKMMNHGSVSPQKLHALADTGSKLALANENAVHKEGEEDDVVNEVSREAATKKQFESTEKSDQEERHKIYGEARQKKIDLHREEMLTEEREKNFRDHLLMVNEQYTKAAHEDQRKKEQDHRRNMQLLTRSEKNTLETKRRENDIAAAQMAADEQTAKENSQFMIQQTQEELLKMKVDIRRRFEEETRKNDLKVKKLDDQFSAEQAKLTVEADQREEEQQKIQRRTVEQNEEAQEVNKEQTRKNAHLNLDGKACKSCVTQVVNFANNGPFTHQCPRDYLLHGFHKISGNNLTSLVSFECCRPCKEDGLNPMTISEASCMSQDLSNCTGNWCRCPANSFLVGLYSRGGTSCVNLSCLQYARCCFIDGSRGQHVCDTVFLPSFNDPSASGFEQAAPNKFIHGFEKTTDSSEGLSRIRNIEQCTYYAWVV